jgi:hypothetical protein
LKEKTNGISSRQELSGFDFTTRDIRIFFAYRFYLLCLRNLSISGIEERDSGKIP